MDILKQYWRILTIRDHATQLKGDSDDLKPKQEQLEAILNDLNRVGKRWKVFERLEQCATYTRIEAIFDDAG